MAIKKTSLYIDENLLKQLKMIVAIEGGKVNDLIIKAIEEKYSDKDK